MLNQMPAELILLASHFIPFDDLERLVWTNRRMVQIFRRNLPMVLDKRICYNKFEIRAINVRFQ